MALTTRIYTVYVVNGVLVRKYLETYSSEDGCHLAADMCPNRMTAQLTQPITQCDCWGPSRKMGRDFQDKLVDYQINTHLQR